MKYYDFKVRVRYAETDKMGVVYHGNYAQYFEIGRVEWLRNLGISYREMENLGVMLPVVSLTMNYKKSAFYDEVLRIRTIFKKMSAIKIEFDYELYNAQDDLLTTGSSVLVFMNMANGRPMAAPNYVVEKITAIQEM